MRNFEISQTMLLLKFKVKLYSPLLQPFFLEVIINRAILCMLFELSLVVLIYLVIPLCSQKVNESG